MKFSTAVSTLVAAAVVSATDCPAPGEYSDAGDYGCNPAHRYPEGQSCNLVGGCYILQPTATTTSAPAPTSSCPAPGDYNDAGDYGCNPAHQYPEGQVCKFIDGCYVIPAATATTTSAPAPTSSCPAPGDFNDAGDYGCNPAHQYPEGQVCKLIDGCYVIPAATTTTTSAPEPTSSCPAPGDFNDAGDYGCNPAHQYPEGQVCKLIDGCYVIPAATATTTSAPAPTSSCPAPGDYSSGGDYGCNPAHRYPVGQSCNLVDGCYILQGTGTPPPSNGTATVGPSSVPTAGVGKMSVAGSIAALGLAAALL